MNAPFRIIRFWTDYKMVKGQPVAEDWVEYCPIGQAQRSTVVDKVKNLARTRDNPDPDDIAAVMALNRWRVIKQAYEAWKSNNEMPLDGTPLAAWPGLTASQADVIRQAGLRTVEDVAGCNDAIMSRVALPGFREIVQHAKRFIENSDKAKVSEELARKDREIEALKADMEEMRRIVLEQAQSEPELNEDGTEAPRRRGRPPKVAA